MCKKFCVDQSFQPQIPQKPTQSFSGGMKSCPRCIQSAVGMLGLHSMHCPFSLVLVWDWWGARGALISVCLGVGHHRPRCKVTRLALAEPRCVCLPHKEISCFAFCLLFFPPPSQALSRGASPPAVVWHCAAIKRWKPGSESGSDRLPGAGRPGPKSIVHLRKLGRVTWQVFKALENFTVKVFYCSYCFPLHCLKPDAKHVPF